MVITKEFLQAKLAELQARRTNALATVNLLNGAIEMTNAFITHLDTPEPEPKTESAPPSP